MATAAATNMVFSLPSTIKQFDNIKGGFFRTNFDNSLFGFDI